MRILQVAHAYPPREWGGTELVTATLAHALAQRGHQVTVFVRTADTSAEEFSLQPDQESESTRTSDDVRVVRVVNNLTHVSTFRLQYENPFLNEALHTVLNEARPDVVHIQHVADLSGEVIRTTAQLGYPIVLSLHDFFFACYRLHLIDDQLRLCPGPERGERCETCLQAVTTADEARYRFSYFERLLRIPQRVIVPSQFLAERMLQIFPFLEPRLQIVAPGIPPAQPTAREDPAPGPLRVLYVGVLMPHKGPHLLIEAARGIPVGSIEISLYGGRVAAWDAYADQLEADASALPIRFCGTYEHPRLSAILAQHDVLVVASTCEETFSLVAREALLAGLPVIAAKRGALPEVIHDGENGLLFEPENAVDLRRCLDQLRTNSPLREKLAHASTPIRTPQEYVQDMERIYGQLCESPHSRTGAASLQGQATRLPFSQPAHLNPSESPTPCPVSICLPTYNGEDFLADALQSILSQSYQDFELIIVDDGSSDATLDIIHSFSDSRIQLHRNPERLGIPANWNRCLSLARGELVCVFHQDDLMHAENIERKVQLLRSDETIGFVHSAVETLVDASAPNSFADWIEEGTKDVVLEGVEYFRTLILQGNRICAPTVVGRRQLLLQHGGFDEDLGFACDYAMWLKICATHRIGFFADPLVSYRWHGGNASHAYPFERGVDEITEAAHRAIQLYQERSPGADGQLLAEALTALDKHRRWAADLQRGKAWLEEQQASWRQVAETRNSLIVELKGWIAELEKGKSWLEEQRDNWQQTAQEQQDQIAKLEKRKAQLKKRIAWLGERLEALQQVLEKSRWGRLGVRLGMVRLPQDRKSAPDAETQS